MREIKFRVYYQNKMLFDSLDLSDIAVKAEDGNLCFVDEMIYQQFTGLKDRNGKEIYEGDILRVKLNPDQIQIGEVEYEQGKYKFMGYDLGWIDYESEVIGNKHENPELLKCRVD